MEGIVVVKVSIQAKGSFVGRRYEIAEEVFEYANETKDVCDEVCDEVRKGLFDYLIALKNVSPY